MRVPRVLDPTVEDMHKQTELFRIYDREICEVAARYEYEREATEGIFPPMNAWMPSIDMAFDVTALLNCA